MPSCSFNSPHDRRRSFALRKWPSRKLCICLVVVQSWVVSGGTPSTAHSPGQGGRARGHPGPDHGAAVAAQPGQPGGAGPAWRSQPDRRSYRAAGKARRRSAYGSPSGGGLSRGGGQRSCHTGGFARRDSCQAEAKPRRSVPNGPAGLSEAVSVDSVDRRPAAGHPTNALLRPAGQRAVELLSRYAHPAHLPAGAVGTAQGGCRELAGSGVLATR